MRPSSKSYLNAMEVTLGEVILPDLNSPYPQFSTRIMKALCASLSLRSKDELLILNKSNRSLSELLKEMIQEIKDNNLSEVVSHISLKDDHFTMEEMFDFEKATELNDFLKAHLVEVRDLILAEKKVIGENKTSELCKKVRDCSYEILMMENELVKPLEEFLSELYKMG